MAFVLTPLREELLASPRNLLVIGGPGSGKTAVALHKASHEILATSPQLGQKILFLSFARATIARVQERMAEAVDPRAREHIEITTYHGWLWKLLRAHGYLLHGPGHLRLLPPPQAHARLAHIRGKPERMAEMSRLLREEKLLHFDLFAAEGSALLRRTTALRRIVADSYPLILIDEFQDTNAAEWDFIKALGQSGSRLIALADPDQRIYEFRGADPHRIQEFIETFEPQIFDFGGENHRSDGRDITAFGNDLLTGANIGRVYNDLEVLPYRFRRNMNDLFTLKTKALQRMRALIGTDPKEWSLGILVPSRQLMLQVSEYLDSKEQRLPALTHDVALDASAPALAAACIATLLEGGADAAAIAQRLLSALCEHMRGRRGDEATPQGELALVDALGAYLQSGQIPRGAKRRSIADGARQIAEARMALVLTGQPDVDWLAMRKLLTDSGIKEYVQIAEDARFLRFLHKGAALRSRLDELWRSTQSYRGASEAVNDALVQEHFAAAVRSWRGIHVMTIHKSKGKEFSEVILYEGRYQGRFSGANAARHAQDRLALRVAVTRARTRATILTPARDPCALL